MDLIDRIPGMSEQAATLGWHMGDERVRHRAYTREVGDDAPDVREGCDRVPPPTGGAAAGASDTSADTSTQRLKILVTHGGRRTPAYHELGGRLPPMRPDRNGG